LQQGANIQQSATQLSNAAARGGAAIDAGSLQSAADALRSGTSAVQSGVQSAQSGLTLVAAGQPGTSLSVTELAAKLSANAPPKPLVPLRDKAPEICKTIEENELRAKDRYLDQRVILRGTFESVSNSYRSREPYEPPESVPGYDPRMKLYRADYAPSFEIYSLRLNAERLKVFAGTKDKSEQQAVLALSKGNRLEVDGIITHVGVDGRCFVTLKLATFRQLSK